MTKIDYKKCALYRVLIGEIYDIIRYKTNVYM